MTIYTPIPQDRFVAALPGRVVVWGLIEEGGAYEGEGSPRRRTTLEHAAVDLWLLALTRTRLRSHASSFSDAAEALSRSAQAAALTALLVPA